MLPCSRFSMNAQNATAQLLYEFVGRVIRQSAKKQ
jgi:hypothetical protein